MQPLLSFLPRYWKSFYEFTIRSGEVLMKTNNEWRRWNKHDSISSYSADKLKARPCITSEAEKFIVSFTRKYEANIRMSVYPHCSTDLPPIQWWQKVTAVTRLRSNFFLSQWAFRQVLIRLLVPTVDRNWLVSWAAAIVQISMRTG